MAAILCPIDTIDLIIYTLNGLPLEYSQFKTSIRTRTTPISIEEFHVLLLCEELNLESAQQSVSNFNSTALIASRRVTRTPLLSPLATIPLSVVVVPALALAHGAMVEAEVKVEETMVEVEVTHKTTPIISSVIESAVAKFAIEHDIWLLIATIIWITPSRGGIPLYNLLPWLPRSILLLNRTIMHIQAPLITLLII